MENFLLSWSVFVSDEAYAHVGNILSIFNGSEITNVKNYYNYFHSSNRIII